MGVSGGESGARHGPSMMPGGPKAAYDRVQPMLEAIAAKVNGEPCVAYIGAGSSGHYVKMVHNGIEYGIMQLLAEVYDLLHRGIGLTNPELADLFDRWHQGELNSFLMEITAKIFRKIDPKTGKHLVDVILDVARQKGTGKWTSQEAMDLQVPLLTIDAAVAHARYVRLRRGADASRHAAESPPHHSTAIAKKVPRPGPQCHVLGDSADVCPGLRDDAKGVANLQVRLDPAAIAKIWRAAAASFRATMLEGIPHGVSPSSPICRTCCWHPKIAAGRAETPSRSAVRRKSRRRSSASGPRGPHETHWRISMPIAPPVCRPT